jgi:DNA replication protein DnaC
MIIRHFTLVPQTLFRDLAMARPDGGLRSLLAQLSRINVLVIDDWVMARPSSGATSGRSARTATRARSTISTSQLPVSRWHEQIGDPTLADGILDCLALTTLTHRDARRFDAKKTGEGRTLS